MTLLMLYIEFPNQYYIKQMNKQTIDLLCTKMYII